MARKYEVITQVGAGSQGEVYMLNEKSTGIERTAKFFYPQVNPQNRMSNYYARKLHKLRECDILMQYRTQETINYKGVPVTFLVSDFVEGELLIDFLDGASNRRLGTFEGLHLLHALARGVEKVHQLGEYHGDLRVDNITVRRRGLGFQVKLMDMNHYGASAKPGIIREDVYDLVRIFYEIIGGSRTYARQPQEVKDVICGLKKAKIIEKFRNAGQLRYHLETMQWRS